MESFLYRREIYGASKIRRQPSDSCTNDLESKWLSRLGVTNTLEDHGGCVNTLRWNNDGTLLASGSDDRCIIVWDISGEKKSVQKTNHDGNIFGVEFLPYGNNKIVATCAADHLVNTYDIEKHEELNQYATEGRVKRLATAQDEPFLFWSACEDGFIRQHDMRTNDVLSIIKDPSNCKTMKTLAICQGCTEKLAVGLGVYYVPIYDRRMLSINEDSKKYVVKCASGDFTRRQPHEVPAYTTHVAFDYYGRELIVNHNGGIYGGSVYVFNLSESSDPTPTVQNLKSILEGRLEPPPPESDVSISPELLQLKETAKNLIYSRDKTDLTKAINCYTKCLFSGYPMTNEQRSILYGNRSFVQFVHNSQGDFYAALRDAIKAIQLNPNYNKGYWRLMKALMGMKQHKLAEEFIKLYKNRFPYCPELFELETKLAEAATTNGTVTNQDIRESPEKMIDYEFRFVGHRNLQTDIKEANFFGTNNQYVISGSDCGSLIIWERKSGLIKQVFQADEDILNIVQPHPEKFLIATSGIENCIRFWEPLPEEAEEPRRRNPDELLLPQHSPNGFYYLHALLAAGLMRGATSDDDEEE